MLRTGCWAALLLVPVLARAQVRLPERLTAGFADQFLGVLAPDGQRLYFVSNQNSTNQIYVQDTGSGASRPVFEHGKRGPDEAADASWPRVSPDGRRLLYISHRDNAAGALCVRDLASLARRCLNDLRSADLQAVWLPGGDGDTMAVVSRGRADGEFAVREVQDRGSLRVLRSLGERVSGLAVSPDGRWLAAVPVRRAEQRIEVSFAGRAAGKLLLSRFDRAGAGAPLSFNLPGATGQPAFSPDGRYLYFTQYLNDTNLDGVIDSNDNGVLFRVAFDGAAARPVSAEAADQPEQLTSATWNCQYPAPAQRSLIMTCAQRGPLNVYALPPDGSVPEGWDRARVLDELSASTDRWEQLLLYGRLLRLSPRNQERVPLLLAMIRLHLGLGEYESAHFYTEELRGHIDATRARLVTTLGELIAHRRAERALDRGQLSTEFVREAQARIGRLSDLAGPAAGVSRSVAAMALLLQSDIHDAIGEKAEALAAFRALRLQDETEPFVLHYAAERGLDLLTPLADREGLLALYRLLAEHEGLPEKDRIRYADAYLKELERGRSRAELPALIQAARDQAPRNSELALVLDLEGYLLQLPKEEDRARSEEVLKGVFGLYTRTLSIDRRRTLINATVRQAAAQDNDYLMYQFANAWVSYLPRSAAEWHHAERLYRRAVAERAYVRFARQDYANARGEFYGGTRASDSLELHTGFIEARLREGKNDIEQQYARYQKDPDHPVARFVRAYLLARSLPALDPAARARAIDEALGHLAVAQKRLPRSLELHHLWGYLEHQRYLQTRASDHAQVADTHYLLALDLAQQEDNPRYRAPLLLALGLLQAAVGNFRIALGHLEERDRLPFADAAGELAHLLALSRCLFHVERAAEAADVAERARLLLGRHGDLSRFRPLLLDRAALYLLAAGKYERARALYAELLRLPEARAPADAETLRNRFVHRLGHAAAALGAERPRETLADLAPAERLLADGKVRQALARAGRSGNEALASYRLMLFGLRAQAHRDLQELDAAAAALAQRQEELARRLRRGRLDEDLLALGLAEAQQAEYALARGRRPDALAHLREGLRHADAYGQKTGTPVHDVGLKLLGAYAELRFSAGETPPDAPDLGERLRRAYDFMCEKRNPKWRAARERFGLYLTLLNLENHHD